MEHDKVVKSQVLDILNDDQPEHQDEGRDHVCQSEEPEPITEECVCSPHVHGLELLKNLERLNVKQKFEDMELITGFETRNIYGISTDNEEIWVAREYSCLVNRIFLGRYRSMEIGVEDEEGREVLRFVRKVPLLACLLPFCFPESFEVFTGGERIGSVEKFSGFHQSFKIKDARGDPVLQIFGSCSFWLGSCFKNLDYRIHSAEGEVGVITKVWGGMVKEGLTDADDFVIEWYDRQLDVKTKSLCLGAIFFIDMFVFESGGSRKTI